MATIFKQPATIGKTPSSVPEGMVSVELPCWTSPEGELLHGLISYDEAETEAGRCDDALFDIDKFGKDFVEMFNTHVLDCGLVYEGVQSPSDFTTKHTRLFAFADKDKLWRHLLRQYESRRFLKLLYARIDEACKPAAGYAAYCTPQDFQFLTTPMEQVQACSWKLFFDSVIEEYETVEPETIVARLLESKGVEHYLIPTGDGHVGE